METRSKRVLEFLSVIEALKDVTRHSWSSSGRQESVAEHTWRMAVMALLVEDEFPEVDFKRVLAMCLFHDLGEIGGDVPAFEKKSEDEEREAHALQKITSILPSDVADRILCLQKEFIECETVEAKLANALDKLEALIQHNDAALSTWADTEYELNLTYGQERTDYHPFLRVMREQIRQKTFDKIKSEAE